MSAGVVSALSVSPIKGTRLHRVESIELGRTGARGDRSFYLIDDRGRMVNAKQLGVLQQVVADWSEDTQRLRCVLGADGAVEDAIELGDRIGTRFFSRPRQDRLVLGPFAEAISEFVGQPLRLVHAIGAVDRGADGAASLISTASLDRLATEADATITLDARRFRMLIEVDGLGAHEEDAWVGREVMIGEAVIRWRGHVGRCLITSRDPDSGEVDLPTLDMLGEYRRGRDTTEPLAFGIYGEVRTAGRVAVGDPVRPA
jgi:uncharacterized protein YcbX